MNIPLKIKKLIEHEKTSISSFEKKIGVGNASISTILKKNSKVSGDIIQKILESYPNLNLDWFFKDEGPMFKNEPKPYKINRDESYPNLANDKEANYLTGIDKLITHTINEILEKQNELLQKEMSDKNYHLSLKIIELLNKKLEILEDVKAGRDS